MTSKSKIELPPNPEIEGLRIVDLIITEIEEAHMNKSCGKGQYYCCLLYTSQRPRDDKQSRMPSSA